MRIFITGISGTLGQAVSKVLLEDSSIEIVGYSKDEKRQSEIKPHPRLVTILGCIRDRRRVIESSRGCDLILHFAALKRIEIAEANPEEAIETNLEGTINVLGAQRAHKIRRVVLASTDKACRPINTYGATKMLCEKLVLRNKSNVVVRYGNVLGSNGSAIPEFVRAIRNDEIVKITDPAMSRFFMRIEEAASFVLRAAFSPDGGLKINEDMRACKISRIPTIIGELLNKKVVTKIIGMRPGEKIHEDLFHQYERDGMMDSSTAVQFSHAELVEILTPLLGDS